MTDPRNGHWIYCEVSPGMFSDERVIEVDGRSFFVDEDDVFENGEASMVRVKLLERDGRRWAILPTRERDCTPL